MTRILICILFFLYAYALQGQQDTLRILFVGNSFTYFWNMPQVVQAMSEGEGTYLLTEQSTAGGATWEQHWKGDKGLTTQERISENDWDFVVFQNHSTSSIDAPDRFREYGTKFGELARKHGAEPIYYMTWAYESNPLMQNPITLGYSKLAKEMDAQVVPIGPIFNTIRKSRPDLDLFFDDKHQSPIGTYVIALTFYKHLTGQSVLPIPDRLITIDQFGQKTYLMFVLSANGKFAKQIVEEFKF